MLYGEIVYKAKDDSGVLYFLIRKDDDNFLEHLFNPRIWLCTLGLAFNIAGDYHELAFKWIPADSFLSKEESHRLLSRPEKM
jgi:hypothetical protein